MCLKKFFRIYIKVLTLIINMLNFRCNKEMNIKQKGEKRNIEIRNRKTEFRNKVIKKPTARA